MSKRNKIWLMMHINFIIWFNDKKKFIKYDPKYNPINKKIYDSKHLKKKKVMKLYNFQYTIRNFKNKIFKKKKIE